MHHAGSTLAHVTRSVLLAGALAAGLAPALAASSALRINGTGSGTGGMAVLARAFMQKNPAVQVVVESAVGSSGGISALLAGQIDVALSNRMPKNSELARAPLLAVEYARTPFVVAVHKDLGITALSTAQLAGLYGEGRQSFPNGQRARPVLRLSEDTDTLLLKSFTPEMSAAVDAAGKRRGMLVANTDSETADLLERTPGAIGASTLALIESEKRQLVALEIDGKRPNPQSLADGSYPYYKTLYLIVGPNASAHTRAFAAYVQSAEGRALLQASGHLPR